MTELSFENLDKYLLQQGGKIIHQVWFGTIPNKSSAKKAYKKMQIYRDSWKVKNPLWCHIEWSKKLCIELVKREYPEHMEMFKQYKYQIQQCDAIRYILLHRYGGWYVDMDYYCNRPLDEVHQAYNNDIYFVQSPNSVLGQDSDHISNSLMYSCPRHKFWRLFLIELEKHRKAPLYYSKHLAVMFTTGPAILNRIYTKYKKNYGLKSLPWKLFHPYGIGDDIAKLKVDPEIYAIHIGKGSWEGKDSKFLLTIARDWKIMIFIVLIMIIPIIICLINRKQNS